MLPWSCLSRPTLLTEALGVSCVSCSVSIGGIGFVLNSGNVESSSVHLSKAFVCYLYLNKKNARSCNITLHLFI